MTMGNTRRIFRHWRWIGIVLFSASFSIGIVAAMITPLQYEAVVGIERRPAQISLQPMSVEYDVTRYTSEDERTIAVLKSRYMMLEWLKVIGIPYSTPRQLERQLKKLEKHFALRPVNFTDLYMLRVQAISPAEATRRVNLLVDLFENWDAAQVRDDSEEITALLKSRLAAIRYELAQRRTDIKHMKLSQTLNLSGSEAESEADTDIKSKQNLYVGIMDELEKAERATDPLRIRRVRVVIPITVSEKPVYSRLDYALIALAASTLLAVLGMLLMEWLVLQPPYFVYGNRTIPSIPASAGN